MWRLRQFLSSVMALSVWTVIFNNNGRFGQYSQSEMITYIFLVALLQNVILSSILNGLAQSVYSGRISHELLKPLNIYLYLAMQEIADKLKNVSFIVIESVILFLVYQPAIITPSLSVILLVVVMVFLATLLNFFISLLFGSLGFWSPDTWAPRFLFFMFIEFTAGRLFPLDILPKTLQSIINLTPFPYFSFIQTQFFLGRLSLAQAGWHLTVLTSWVLFFGFISMKIWQRGLKDYSAAGQ
jgi:ABC-2 type transport system permease protein